MSNQSPTRNLRVSQSDQPKASGGSQWNSKDASRMLELKHYVDSDVHPESLVRPESKISKANRQLKVLVSSSRIADTTGPSSLEAARESIRWHEPSQSSTKP